MHGTLGKGVLLLSDDQRENLLERLGLDAFNYYTDKLSTLLTEGKVKSKNHYATIMKWYLEDKENLDREYPYLTEAEMDGFVTQATAEILDILHTNYDIKL